MAIRCFMQKTRIVNLVAVNLKKYAAYGGRFETTEGYTRQKQDQESKTREEMKREAKE